MSVRELYKKIDLEALRSDIRAALINNKAYACPIAMRVAWHAAGTWDKNDDTGGSDGARMRFEPEASDPANAGLIIVRDMLHEVKKKYPEVSEADLWTFAGCAAVEFMGGPRVPHRFGRTDDPDGTKCPNHGRLPDAAQGAEHLRAVFGERMGFSDQEIVALSGGHTVGRCHQVRSGYDGPWTHDPLRFDNEYFRNLVEKEWKPRDWDGEFQYTDVETESLVMLPTDIALIKDDAFREHVDRYAADESAFFDDFAQAYAKLMALGCPEECDPFGEQEEVLTEKEQISAEFRELAMHGSIEPMQKIAPQADVHEVEPSSGRSALHKSSFWGHIQATDYLVNECGLDLNAVDHNGDTALHDAARFGHEEIVNILLAAGPDLSIANKKGRTALDVAVEYEKKSVAEMIRTNMGS